MATRLRHQQSQIIRTANQHLLNEMIQQMTGSEMTQQQEEP